MSVCEVLVNGTLIAGVTSGATARIAWEPTLTVNGPPTWTIRVILEDVVGTFIAGEALKIDGVQSRAVTVGSPSNLTQVCTPTSL